MFIVPYQRLVGPEAAAMMMMVSAFTYMVVNSVEKALDSVVKHYY